MDMDIHGYIHGYIHVWILDLGHTVDISMDIVQCTALKCIAVKEVFQHLLGQLLLARSKNVVKKAIKLYDSQQQHLDTCERCPEVRRTASQQVSTVE